MILTGILAGLAAAVAALALHQRYLGFAGQKPQDYAALSPGFDPRRHLAGPILCEGVIYGPLGRVATRFVADMEGTWDGDEGRLKENFRYDSGTTQAREWQLSLRPGGTIVARAADLVGEGAGAVAGAAVVLRYRIRLEPSAGGHVLDVTDWMYLMENGTIMNRSQFFKFGIKVAELVATMRPAPPGGTTLAGKRD